ncbi:MAG: mechanosensitive ion channel [Betaproteobacteria bacterium]|nr:mechanosensitive ion channel [Betaproteobacteria bacterium]
MKNPELYNLLQELWTDLQDVRVLWQLAVIGVSLAAGAWVSRLMQPRLGSPDETLKFTLGGVQRVQLPLTALVLVLIGRAVLKPWQSVNLLNVAVPLLTALAIVRVVVYALRRVFAPGGWLRASERFIAWAVWMGFAIYITGLAPELVNFLDGAGFGVGKDRISLLLILQAALSVAVTLLAALWLGRAIESRVMRARTLDVNVRVMFAKLSRALLVLVAVLIALPAVGIDLTVLSVFGGALGVGLGFGLQKIAANYLSGFIMLTDRSVSIGDQVTIDRYFGELTQMTARYVVLRNPDGTEAIIPNETVISSPVINHSYSDQRVRVPVSLQVGYRTDLDRATRILEDAARRHPRVLRDPAPAVLIKEFGDSGIDLELGVWIEDPQQGEAGLRSDLYREIWREFQAQGIEIPYPQREVRVVGDARAAARES